MPVTECSQFHSPISPDVPAPTNICYILIYLNQVINFLDGDAKLRTREFWVSCLIRNVLESLSQAGKEVKLIQIILFDTKSVLNTMRPSETHFVAITQSSTRIVLYCQDRLQRRNKEASGHLKQQVKNKLMEVLMIKRK